MDPSVDDEEPATHLGDLPDGAGCAEIWDHLSDCRDDTNHQPPQH